ERHIQPHPDFCREYEKAARRIDPALVATAPGREQYQRWLSGRVWKIRRALRRGDVYSSSVERRWLVRCLTDCGPNRHECTRCWTPLPLAGRGCLICRERRQAGGWGWWGYRQQRLLVRH